MASTTLYPRSGSMSNGFSPLAIVGYAVLAILLSYVSLRVYSYLKLKSQARTTLPKPVSGSTHKSAFNLGRSSGWDWRRWTLPRVPGWPKVPDVMGKAKMVANSKNLTVELLPTTGLPPPPKSVTTPMPVSMDTSQLVDLSTPATPPLTTASTSGSFQPSPRTPSPFMHHIQPSKPLYPTNTYTSFSRSPSPHSFLATSPQKGHRRSKSLGGVPIRRLSSGTSGLRHAMEMQEFSANHVRGTSREHLLIDFTSSGSDDEDDLEGGFTKISPAASDIGVLPLGKEIPPRVDARTVGRHVPLVDLGDEDSEDLMSSPRPLMKVDDESWKLFGLSPNIPALPFTRFSRSSDTEPKLVSHFEQSVDAKNEPCPELVLGSDLIDVRRLDSVIHQNDQPLVDLNSSPKIHARKEEERALIDLQGNFQDEADPSATSRPLLSGSEGESYPAEIIKSTSIPFPNQTPVLVKADFPHPLETLVNVEILHRPVFSASEDEAGAFDPKPSLLFQREYMPSDHEPQDLKMIASPTLSEVTLELSAASLEFEKSSLVSNPSVVEPSKPASSPDIWTWEEQDGTDDPWANHISDISPSGSPTSPDSEVFVYTGLDVPVEEDKPAEEDLITLETSISPDVSDVFVYDPELGILEKSPGATLFATELVDEEESEMPVLDLGGIQLPSSVSSDVSGTNVLEEEDLTPKPTPASVELMLPSLLVDSGGETLVRGSFSPVDGELDYADPELLPLPDSPPILMVDIPDPETPSLMFEKDDRLQKSTPSQTPTPPASPPPISPLRVLGASNILQSKPVSTLSDKSQGTMSSFGISPTPGLTLAVGRSPKNFNLGDLEDKENMTPTASNTTVSEIWEIQHGDVPLAPPISRQIPKSPSLSKRIFMDVAAEATGEKDNIDNESNKETTLPSSPTASTETQASQDPIQGLEHSSLPGTFPESGAGGLKPPAELAASTVGARLALTSDTLKPRPSARDLVRSPIEIALAMQLRPGLGAGADPAWMVRFLMTMFGWFAVVVSGQAEF